MMRLGFAVSLALGSILIIGGVVAAFSNVKDAAVMINSGSMLVGASGFAKAIQKKFEADVS